MTTNLKAKEVAELLNVSVKTVYYWKDIGHLEGVPLGPTGKCIRFRQKDVDKLIQQREGRTVEQPQTKKPLNLRVNRYSP